ncbi:hypothetical protein ABGB14_26775 [Nonomuraea sp. B10E15]|uniref:hypothetical protein n=1 Tax=unclassified Nonomuraea TaxID=2593643 RepID=UPI00325C83F2
MLIAGFGLVCTLVGGGVIAKAISNSNQNILNKQYVTNLWRNLPAETLFPATIGMWDPQRRDQSGSKGWTRAALSSETSCGKALAGTLAEEAAERGCMAAMRASYVNDSGGTAATVVIIAFGKPDADNDLDAILDQAQHDKRDYGIRVLAAPGTKWTNSARAGSGAYSVQVPNAQLFVAATAGPVDGRRPGKIPQPWGDRDGDDNADRAPWAKASDGLSESISAHLAAQIDKARP